MNILMSVKQELQHIIEAMHAVTNVDITIVDEDLQRIASTVDEGFSLGAKAPIYSAFHKCIITGDQYFLENPKEDPLCSECVNIENCMELVELCIPIKFSGKIIGVIGMCAYDEKARQNLLMNRESFMNFESQLVHIISTVLSEKKIMKMLEYSSSELMTLINSLNEGIIIINNNHEIINTNKYANDKLNIDTYSIPDIWNLLSEKVYNAFVDKDFTGEVGPVKLNNKEFVINANPIMVKDKREGTVLVLSDFDKMKESVIEFSRKKDMVTFDDIVGESELLKQARREAMQVADSDVPVLILGETGTGKEVFARAIHNLSARKNEVFMAINCGAIPENLIESELFGYEKGSFTGANVRGNPGKFEICKDGTLFLDEIGDLPLSMQVKLNRVLEEKEILRVGGNTPIKVNPRIISATHRSLASMVEKNLFRDDLYYRLNVVPIYLPPLRERGYDVIILSRYFLNRFNNIYKKQFKGFTTEAEQLLMGYKFPGNIRELRNLIEYAVIFEEGSYIGAENLRKKVAPSSGRNLKLSELTRLYEKSVISNKIQELGGDLESKKEAARQLGISIATLYRKLE
ncbi:MAG: sigma 54-interacting transcriptional regulator [Bacillota bacterium]|jgi:transcriptional regulator with PAS, ATPase and Fis domain|nr:sigma 54-interacting transcriptional regulator [Bacillota bacterium]NLL61029.1 sigma 54-interacting transcriptional regulator [Tissierellia bacterium]